MTLARSVFAALTDGAEHSGESLAQAAGVTRSAVWKAIEQLRELGLDIEAHTHRGYRLRSSAVLLDATELRRSLSAEIRAVLNALEVVWESESTNAQLLAVPAPPVGQFDVLIAENQTQGRGRRGRSWQSTLGGSICLSIATTYEPLPRDLPALTLAIGVCVKNAVEAAGGKGLALKWPNDLVLASDLSKLGGILVELRAEAGGPAQVVIGIGLNISLSAAARKRVVVSGNTPADLAECGVLASQRHRLAALVITECVLGLEHFGREGFAPFLEAWRAADALRDRQIELSDASGNRRGAARGIDRQGALQVEFENGARVAVLAGEVTVRSDPRVADRGNARGRSRESG